MALYPSLEDMKADQLIRAQDRLLEQLEGPQNPSAPPSYDAAQQDAMYPALRDYMGLELTPDMIRANMPEYAAEAERFMAVAVPQPNAVVRPASGMIAPISGQSLGLQRAQVTHGIREVILCKDAVGKVGLRVKALNTGVFVCLVQKDSPAAKAGLRFGDQILQINGDNVAGYSMDKVHGIFKRADVNNIALAVRDRPFERTLTLHKDSTGHIGFHFKNGSIQTIVKDSSAARNGLLTEHNLLEVNGQNVVGLKDKEITKLIDEGGNIITITVMPTYIFGHIVKSMAIDFWKKTMDHGIPEL